MEYKIRANIIMSRNLTVEANNLKEAMEKVKDMMAKPFCNTKTSKVISRTDPMIR